MFKSGSKHKRFGRPQLPCGRLMIEIHKNVSKEVFDRIIRSLPTAPPDGYIHAIDFPGYLVNREGKIWSVFKGDNMACSARCGSGGERYAIAMMDHASGKRRAVTVQSVVMLAYVGPRPSTEMDILHRNGDSLDNRLENLRYGTKVENMADKDIHGTMPRGERSPNAKLTDDSVRRISALHDEGMSDRKIAEMFGVSKTAIWQVRNGRTWTHI
jgi:hypothetical protein